MKLCVDVAAENVRLGTLVFEGQWVDFYALLAVNRCAGPDSERYLSADELARVGPWRHKAVNSVGKEVARHLNKLARAGAGGLLQHRGRTQAWRLAVAPPAIALLPAPDTVRAWLTARSVSDVRRDHDVNALHVLVHATVELSKGTADDALKLLTGASAVNRSAEPALAAWGALIHGRALFQENDEQDDGSLVALHQEWSRRADAPGRAVAARLRAFVAMRHRFEDPRATLASLTKLAADLEMRGDLGSLGSVLNVMGLLARRAGSPEAATGYHLRAAALFGIGGDHAMLQAALFNLALCRREALAAAGLPPDDGVLTLVDLCLQVCARYGVGGDSAQAEISGAQWAHELHQTARARAYLEGAEKIVALLDSTFEQACFLEVRAEIDLAYPREGSDPLRDLRAAERLFTEVGDNASAVRARRRRLAAGGSARSSQ